MVSDLSWPEVLATLEAHAESAELLLSTHIPRAGSNSDDAEFGFLVVASWEWTLPEPNSLPPLPSELEDRAKAIKDRMDRLQARLSHELQSMHVGIDPHRMKFPSFSQSVYIDVTV